MNCLPAISTGRDGATFLTPACSSWEFSISTWPPLLFASDSAVSVSVRFTLGYPFGRRSSSMHIGEHAPSLAAKVTSQSCGMRRFIPKYRLVYRLSETVRSEEHTSELQSHVNLVCRLLLEKKKKKN